MNSENLYLIIKYNKIYGGIELKEIDKKNEYIYKEVEKLYKDLKLDESDLKPFNKNKTFFEGYYDYSKRSYTDNKSGVRTRENNYGRFK